MGYVYVRVRYEDGDGVDQPQHRDFHKSTSRHYLELHLAFTSLTRPHNYKQDPLNESK